MIDFFMGHLIVLYFICLSHHHSISHFDQKSLLFILLILYLPLLNDWADLVVFGLLLITFGALYNLLGHDLFVVCYLLYRHENPKEYMESSLVSLSFIISLSSI